MRSARRDMEGFILAATLWVLVGLTMLAAYVDGVVATDVERAVEAGRSLESELARRNTEATLIYLLSTGRMNHRGLILEEEQRFSDSLLEGESLPDRGDGELRVRGEIYAGLGGARFSIQDERGLASVNAPEFPLFAALLGHAGVSPADVEWIVPRMMDYIDADGDLILNGAEHEEYRRQGMPPPLNWIMSSPLELGNVLGFDALPGPGRRERLWPLLTMRPMFGYNFDTMRPEILAALLDLDDRVLRGVLEERETRPISRLDRIAVLTGRHLDIDEIQMVALPSSFLRIAVWHEDDTSRILSGIELTPSGDRSPWRKDYRYSEPITIHDDARAPHEPPLQAATPLFR